MYPGLAPAMLRGPGQEKWTGNGVTGIALCRLSNPWEPAKSLGGMGHSAPCDQGATLREMTEADQGLTVLNVQSIPVNTPRSGGHLPRVLCQSSPGCFIPRTVPPLHQPLSAP